jgi:arylsulfatase A-like enzyme
MFRRRDFIKSLCFGAASAMLPKGSKAKKNRKPNVIIIFADDQGSVDMNCYGAKDLVTPHMDSIAKKGVRFTQFYSLAPVCSPSRAGLLSGKTPQKAGVPGNIGIDKEGMPSKEYLIPEMMKKAGYRTAHIGKWHLGHFKETMPNGQGFDYSFGHMVGCIDNYSHFFYWKGPNKHDLFRNGKEVYHYGEFFPDMMLKEACGYIEKNRAHPFFMYYAMNTPHYPYQGDPKWLDHYKKLKYPRNLYAAFISTMDERVGALLKKIRDLGLEKDTIIIYQSDNGHSIEERAHFGGGSSGPYSGAKSSVLEGGIRLPAMISWPGKLPENEVRGQMAVGCDWYPTIAELVGIKLEHEIDGKSLMPVIKSKNAPSQHKVFNWALGKKINQWAVREGPWKLVFNPRGRDKGLYLYNIPKDPAEKKDLAEKYPEIAARLKGHHIKWKKSFE